MCWAEKCCYFIPANFGCILLGATSFILSTFLMAASITCYIIASKTEPERVELGAKATQPHLRVVLGLELNTSSIHLIFGILVIVALLWMLSSVLLVVGVMKNKASMVLAYFAFGIIITILGQLSALLVLLHNKNNWIMALLLFITFSIHIHYLVVVHTVYDLMQRGKDFRIRQHSDDQDPLADCFDPDTETI